MNLTLKPSTRLHLKGLLGTAIGTIWSPILYYFGLMAEAPWWLRIAMPLFCPIALYVWLRQGLSQDNTRCTPTWR
jgi:hypothetical protein